MHATKTIADALYRDLSVDSLRRYVAEQERMIENALRHGRSTRRLEHYRKAGLQALERHGISQESIPS